MENFAEHIAYKQGIYQNAMKATGYHQILIAAGSLNYQFRDDIPVAFSANAYFREWLPLLLHPDSYLLVSPNSDKPTLFLKVVADYWHSAPEALPSAIISAVEVVDYATAGELSKLLSLRGENSFCRTSGGRAGWYDRCGY